MVIKIGVDNGNKNTKTAHAVFNTGVVSYKEKPEITNEWLKYDGIYYCLSAERIGYTKDKTKDERFFVLTLFAIAKELIARSIVDSYMDISLGLGLPPEHMSMLKTAYMEFYNKQNVCFEYGNRSFCVNIVDVRVFPQGYAAAVKHLNENQELLKYPKLYLLDIGGRTVDIVELNQGRINILTCQSREDGINTVYNAVKREMRKHDVLITENEIDNIINGELNGIFLSQDIIEIVRQTASCHVKKLMLSISEDGYDLTNSYVIFIGGGSKLLRPFLIKSNQFNNFCYCDDIHGNAKGYEYLMRSVNPKG